MRRIQTRIVVFLLILILLPAAAAAAAERKIAPSPGVYDFESGTGGSADQWRGGPAATLSADDEIFRGGVRAGRDEVLEAAVARILGREVSDEGAGTW